jgi:hypothetical protein
MFSPRRHARDVRSDGEGDGKRVGFTSLMGTSRLVDLSGGSDIAQFGGDFTSDVEARGASADDYTGLQMASTFPDLKQCVKKFVVTSLEKSCGRRYQRACSIRPLKFQRPGIRGTEG